MTDKLTHEMTTLEHDYTRAIMLVAEFLTEARYEPERKKEVAAASAAGWHAVQVDRAKEIVAVLTPLVVLLSDTAGDLKASKEGLWAVLSEASKLVTR
jgi:hypothetical protein